MFQKYFLSALFSTSVILVLWFLSGPVQATNNEDKIKKLEQDVITLKEKLKKLENLFLAQEKEYKEHKKKEKEQEKFLEKFRENFEKHQHHLEMRPPASSWEMDRYHPFKVEGKEIQIGKPRY